MSASKTAAPTWGLVGALACPNCFIKQSHGCWPWKSTRLRWLLEIRFPVYTTQCTTACCMCVPAAEEWLKNKFFLNVKKKKKGISQLHKISCFSHAHAVCRLSAPRLFASGGSGYWILFCFSLRFPDSCLSVSFYPPSCDLLWKVPVRARLKKEGGDTDNRAAVYPIYCIEVPPVVLRSVRMQASLNRNPTVQILDRLVLWRKRDGPATQTSLLSPPQTSTRKKR